MSSSIFHANKSKKKAVIMILQALLFTILFQNCITLPIPNIQQTAPTDSEPACQPPELEVSQIIDIVCTEEKLSSTSVLQRKMNKDFEVVSLKPYSNIPLLN